MALAINCIWVAFFWVKHVAATTFFFEMQTSSQVPKDQKCDDIPMLQLFMNLNEITTFTTSVFLFSKLFMPESSLKNVNGGMFVPSKKRNKQTDLPWLHPHSQ